MKYFTYNYERGNVRDVPKYVKLIEFHSYVYILFALKMKCMLTESRYYEILKNDINIFA
jgi:hypothetical protein